MKKVLIVLGIIAFSLLFIKKEVKPVFIEKNEDFSFYLLSFENNELTTKNFVEIFINYKIIYIEPYVSNLYKERINLNRYSFDYTSISKNINVFTNKYINILKEKGFKKEALNFEINGISINKVKVYCCEEEINILKSKINLKYEKIYE